MADSVRYPLDSKSDVNRAELLDRAAYVADGPVDDDDEHSIPMTSVLDEALAHYVHTFENMQAMKEAGDVPGREERERWETPELRFALYPRIRTERGSHP